LSNLVEVSNKLHHTWREWIQKVCLGYINQYVKDKEGFISVLKNTKTPALILNMLYNQLIFEKSIENIDSLTKEEKIRLASHFEKSPDLKKYCIALYTLEKV